ncbi:Rhodanese-related sulfurtransferase [Lutimaribacter pacificus]|uniref:Rhodanese-related sulfurtransferase n=1 Tax=Lutimaribacter pacificus TaxID=391948 RepID=A0A1H0D2U7_9RHOB|nr:rhodanese-like domain-containing protein [Lutimaribacter pacificus]SDN64211.1 Rhodanese-related sulfurtransferase [Lutimaribacter pacificus]SHJ37871.1 Rhodanese-related sulfurtransferase [Lutimaribacter pacificus]
MRIAVIALALLAGTAQAEEVAITKDMPNVTVETGNGPVVIERIQDPAHEITGEWARTSRPCPNFCVQPIIPAPGVTPIGELELIGFLNDPDVVVIDGRVRRDFETGAIPGAVNVPYTEAGDRLGELGCEPDFEGFICEGDDIKSAALYCNGPWCGQSPAAARRMIEAGFPAEKIYYYRPGMQGWRMLGLTVTGE